MRLKLLRRLALVLTACALPAAHALGLPAPKREDDFARAFQELRASYLSELRKQGFVGSSFYFVRDN